MWVASPVARLRVRANTTSDAPSWGCWPVPGPRAPLRDAHLRPLSPWMTAAPPGSLQAAWGSAPS
eukprot:5719957-Pyramimonas_sp.AAC.1